MPHLFLSFLTSTSFLWFLRWATLTAPFRRMSSSSFELKPSPKASLLVRDWFPSTSRSSSLSRSGRTDWRIRRQLTALRSLGGHGRNLHFMRSNSSSSWLILPHPLKSGYTRLGGRTSEGGRGRKLECNWSSASVFCDRRSLRKCGRPVGGLCGKYSFPPFSPS